MKEALLIVVIVVVVSIVGILGARWKCETMWKASGMQARFEVGAGCLVKRKDGTWFPATNLRDTSP